jgi:Prolyl oligopeptidase family
MPFSLDRRTLLRLMPVLAAALDTELEAQAPVTPPVVTREMLHHALGLVGIALTEAQENMALNGVNRNFNSYVQLRNIDIPLDTEPLFRFYPAAPAMRQARFLPRKPELKSFASVEDLAFRPATELGALMRARVSHPRNSPRCMAEGIADPKRVGILGGSYGGYATLAGVAFTPDVYAAAVDIVGPSNLITLLDSIPPYW